MSFGLLSPEAAATVQKGYTEDTLHSSFLLQRGGPLIGWIDDRGAGGALRFGFRLRAQSVPKRSGTGRHSVARRGTKWQVRDYTNCLTSSLASTDKA